MHRKYAFIGIQRWAIGMSLRKIAAALAEAGHLNERVPRRILARRQFERHAFPA